MFDLKQIQKMQKELADRMERVQEELKAKTVEASAGGGIVTATVNGNQELVGICIKPEAVDEDDPADEAVRDGVEAAGRSGVVSRGLPPANEIT